MMQLVKEYPIGKGIKLFSNKGPIVLVDGKVGYLFEWVDYYLEVPGNGEFKVFLGDEEAEVISNNLYKITSKNYIGKSKLEIRKNGRTILRIDVEIISEKFAKIGKNKVEDVNESTIGRVIENYRTFVEAITAELKRRALELPFSIKSPTGFEFVESDDPVSELFAYHFLRNNKDRIISAYEEILKRPHKKLLEELGWVHFWEVSEIDEDTILSIAQYPENLIEVKTPGVEINGSRYAPLKLLQKEKYETFDTLENRFAKYFLSELINWSERVLESFSEVNIGDETIEGLLHSLEYFWNDPIFSEVGEFTMFPYTSQVLLKREGYRDLLELWKEFRAYSPFFGELNRVIENKDVAKLYEYWCFFKLVEKLGKILGKKSLRIIIEPTGELHESDSKEEVYAEFSNGWRLYYNKKLAPRKWSYSVSLRPDFSLFSGDPSDKRTRLIGVFDAKFKFEPVDLSKFADEEKKMEKNPDLQTWAKLEDIYKMHTYKDALNAQFAVVLYPGKRSIFYDLDRGKIESFTISDTLRGNIRGVGYLGFIPEVIEDENF
ncbi:hypothetical protein PNA2_1832 [Pyrococcus sp. NA2]|uniref:DUF2357 domain-containing protein n=1 Tax=Pyrococcus sp. (strain NA2) TaxID=342949 RepID=UPI000209AC6B|nr:DUF2357 domain-containing protein [Pyrococcus sp. NA2]AEC52747.1 hypothetical protein PNA2_1832 [Pyrococcus sp. NA2]